MAAPIEVRVKRLSEHAALLVYEGEEAWVPLSLIEDDDLDEDDVGETRDVTIRSWKKEQLGWA